MASRINSPVFAPGVSTPRKRLTEAERAEALAASDGKCVECGDPISDIDHEDPLFFGGAEAASNRRGLCKPCHILKGKAEAGPMAKVRRQIAKSFGEREPSRLQGRGFDQTKTRGFDGKVKARVQRRGESR